MTTNRSNRKERLFTSVVIRPFTQIKFGIYVISISLIFMISTCYLFIRSFKDQYRQVMDIFQVVDPDIKWEVMTNEVFNGSIVRLTVFLSIYLCVMLYTIFKLTHRYYGPLVSIERFLDEITAGNYDARVSIRSEDELQDLTKKLNELAAVLEERHGNTQK